MLTCLRAFFEDLLIQSVAFPFRALILYAKFTQSRFVLIKKNSFIRTENLSEIFDWNIESFDRKFFRRSFFVETFSAETFRD